MRDKHTVTLSLGGRIEPEESHLCFFSAEMKQVQLFLMLAVVQTSPLIVRFQFERQMEEPVSFCWVKLSVYNNTIWYDSLAAWR